MNYPPVRFVEAIPIEQEGQPLVMLRDPEGLTEQTLAVPMPVFLVMTLLDGQRGAHQIQETVTQAAGGQIMTTEQIDSVVQELDEHFLLVNERSARKRVELERAFEAMDARPATHAGSAYPEEAPVCANMFGELFDESREAEPPGRRPRGLIVPHIDLRVGGRSLAETLSRIAATDPAQLYVILGVAHQPTENLFTLTRKSFETPFGPVQTDQQACDILEAACGEESLAGEYAHKLEHSVEFPTVALRYHHREKPDFKILPILCGQMEEELADEPVDPTQRPEVGRFVQGLRRIIDHYDGRACLIASVDLAHVGRKFGDDFAIDDLRKQMVQTADERLLEQIEQMDPEGFFESIRTDRNARHVDATTAVFVLMQALGTGRVERVDYQQWHENATESMVSYTGLALY